MNKKLDRRNEILNVALNVLAERGYRDTTMLEIAKRASASKETLYSWFYNKSGLFEEIIARNANTIKTALQSQLDQQAPIESVLNVFGYELLELLLSDEAISINRAAISESPIDLSLAQALLSKGRNATLPQLIIFLEEKIKAGELIKNDPKQVAEVFLGLLIRDKQTLRLLGLIKKPSKSENKQHSVYATQLLLRLYAKN